MTGYKSIFMSTTFWGNIISLLAMFEPKVFAIFGLTSDTTGQLAAVNYIVAGLGQVVSIIGRLRATKQVTLTGAPPTGQ